MMFSWADFMKMFFSTKCRRNPCAQTVAIPLIVTALIFTSLSLQPSFAQSADSTGSSKAAVADTSEITPPGQNQNRVKIRQQGSGNRVQITQRGDSRSGRSDIRVSGKGNRISLSSDGNRADHRVRLIGSHNHILFKTPGYPQLLSIRLKKPDLSAGGCSLSDTLLRYQHFSGTLEVQQTDSATVIQSKRK
ncbi:MAG: hypothetical protein GVY08_05760 [Bacteroidetes bacterium]|jgi:hypothetical protein|nr:hypothetical protein [Bacteroidota bacterium]